MAKREYESDDESADVAKQSPQKKRAPAVSSEVTALVASLPSSVLSQIWSFTANLDGSDKTCSNSNDRLLLYSLYKLRLVGRAWNELAVQILEQKLGNVAILDAAVDMKKRAKDATDKLVVTLPNPEKAAAITDVRIIMGNTYSTESFDDNSVWSDDEQAFVSFRVERSRCFAKGIPEIDWEASLQPVAANLTRLDLSRMLLYDKNLGDVLRVAAKLCPNIKAVLLPHLENKRFRNEDVHRENMKALSDAMKSWHESNGGLHHLRLPYLGMNTKAVSQFVVDLAVYCPDLEYFDGYKSTFYKQVNCEFVTCDLFLPVGLMQWIKFWETCTKLREFNTVLIPFADLYYNMMADLPEMPQLEELTISHSTLMHRSEEGVDGELFDELMPKFPALKKLKVVFGDEQDDENWAVGNTFDDSFISALPTSNPSLEVLDIHSFNAIPITTDGLRELLQSRKINRLSVATMESLENDVGDFAVMWRELIEEKWTLRMNLQAKILNDSIWETLMVVRDCAPDQLDGVCMSLSLRVKERFGYKPSEEGEEETNCQLHTVEEVEELYEELKQLHGNTVRVHLHITEPNDPESGEGVQFDSLELSINDPQGFGCKVDKVVLIGNECVEQELCEEKVRVDGVYVRDPEGALEALETAEHWRDKRFRKVRITGARITGLMSDDEFGEGSDGEDLDEDNGAVFFDDGEDDDESDDESDDGDDDDDDDDDGQDDEDEEDYHDE